MPRSEQLRFLRNRYHQGPERRHPPFVPTLLLNVMTVSSPRLSVLWVALDSWGYQSANDKLVELTAEALLPKFQQKGGMSMDIWSFAIVGIIVAFAAILFCVLVAIAVVLLMGTQWMQKRVHYYLRDRKDG